MKRTKRDAVASKSGYQAVLADVVELLESARRTSAERNNVMSTALRRPADSKSRVRPLRNGQRMSQPEFHRRYLACPEGIKAELVGGIVYMASPLHLPHATHHLELGAVFCLYKAATPGVEGCDNGTIILSDDTEVQADLTLRRLPEWGGRSRTTKENYMAGGPELLAEISHRTRGLDLNKKRVKYEQAGVVEYLVVCLEDPEIYWFDFAGRKQIKPGRDGIMKSRVFSGLWLDGAALLDRDTKRLLSVLQQGLAHRSHAAFVRRLEATQRRK